MNVPQQIRYPLLKPSSKKRFATLEAQKVFSERSGVYRAAFTTIEQTTTLTKNKIERPVLAIGGEKALGAKVAQMVKHSLTM